MKSQNAKIRTYLEKGGCITPLQALKWWGCFRLASRINDLRNEGMKIQTKMTKKNDKVYATYKAEI